MNQLKQDIEGPNPTPLEKLLAQRIAVCWLEMCGVDRLGATRQSYSVAEAEYWDKHAERLQRRFQSAIKTLATIRRLQLPAVQVNIGEKQVNIATLTGREDGSSREKE